MARTGTGMDQGVLGDSMPLLPLWDGWSCSRCLLVSPRKCHTHQGNALMGQVEPVWSMIPWVYHARAFLAGCMELKWVLGALSGGVAAIVRVSHGVEQTETALGNYLKCLYCVTIHAVMGRSVGKKWPFRFFWTLKKFLAVSHLFGRCSRISKWISFMCSLEALKTNKQTKSTVFCFSFSVKVSLSGAPQWCPFLLQIDRMGVGLLSIPYLNLSYLSSCDPSFVYCAEVVQ